VLYPQNRHLSPKVRAFADWAAEIFARCPLLSGKDDEYMRGDYDSNVCTFGNKQPDGTTVRDIIEQRNVAETVL
jgi:LysR family transcriptional regulator for bpeEF and oprC